MARVPWPGRPGKWFRLYSHCLDSNAIRETRATISPRLVIWYFWIAWLMATRARWLVAHSGVLHEPGLARAGIAWSSCANVIDGLVAAVTRLITSVKAINKNFIS